MKSNQAATGLLYVALQLPGVKLFSSTPGVVVRLVPID